MARPKSKPFVGRLFVLMCAFGLAYVSLVALWAGIARPDYVLILIGTLFAVLGTIGALLGFRGDEE